MSFIGFALNIWKDSKGTGGGGGITYDPSAIAIFDSFTIPPTDARKTLINNVVVGAKDAGIWDILDYMHFYAAADSQAALINWINPGTYDATLFNAPTFTSDSGFDTNGTTNLIKVGFNPFTASSPNYSLNSACIGAWVLRDLINSSSGYGFFSSGGTTIAFKASAISMASRINCASQFFASVPGSNGLSALNRDSATQAQSYRNGVLIDNDVSASDSIRDGEFQAGGTILDTASYSNEFTFDFGGGSLTETQHGNLYTIVEAYLSGVGAI